MQNNLMDFIYIDDITDIQAKCLYLLTYQTLGKHEYPELFKPNANDLIYHTNKMPFRYDSMNSFIESSIYAIQNEVWDRSESHINTYKEFVVADKIEMIYRLTPTKLYLLNHTLGNPSYKRILNSATCSPELKRYLEHCAIKILRTSVERMNYYLQQDGITSTDEFHALLKQNFKVSLLPERVLEIIREKFPRSPYQCYYLFTKNDIQKFGLQEIEPILTKSGWMASDELINQVKEYNDTVEDIINNKLEEYHKNTNYEFKPSR